MTRLLRVAIAALAAVLAVPVIAVTSASAASAVSAASVASSVRVAAPPPSGIGIALLDAAIARRDDPRAHIYIDDFVAPGTTLVRHVRVTNYDSTTAHLLMYADASSVGPSGWVVADGHATNELTSWITVTPSTMTLAPRTSGVATVTIAVPRNASSEERYATIIAELPAQPKPGQQLAIATRVGVRVYLSIGAGGEPPSNFTISTLTAQRDTDGTPEVTAQVTNTGKRALDVGGSLSLSNGPGGLRAGPFQVNVPRTIGIGESADVVVRLDRQTPAGPWLAEMTLRSGFVQHTVTATITFPAKAGTSSAPVKAVPLVRNRHVLVPIALGIMALVLAGLCWLWWRHHRHRRGDAEAAAGHIPAPRTPSSSSSSSSSQRSRVRH